MISGNNKNNSILLDKELKILRNAVEVAEKKNMIAAKTPTTKVIYDLLEQFLRSKKLICYGGTAINNILPKADQFYDRNIELPDYDFFTTDAINTAKQLADIYYKYGFDEVEAKAGIHLGTYKVFVNFMPIADITEIPKELFNNLQKNSIIVNNIHYAPPNYLRMAAYLELSRPNGDVSRWEKVWKRLTLLNINYPINVNKCNIKDFIRKFEDINYDSNSIYKIVLNSIIKQKLIFFGGYALYQYGKYLSQNQKKLLSQNPDFDVLAIDPEKSAKIIKNDLHNNNIKNVSIIKHRNVGEIIPEHIEIKINKDTIIFLFKPLACHSYNSIKINNKIINIATIDTMLSLYLAFIYINRPYFDEDRILCIAQYLFYIQFKNRLKQRGVLKRFSTSCYGEQHTLDAIRAEKAFLYNKFKNKTCSKEYEKYFLRYIPSQPDKCKKTIKNKTKKNKTKKN
tara:strand:+ start:679 stop:2040 length:1362 start_codon:yes stop_codon:yes gene_type:complete